MPIAINGSGTVTGISTGGISDTKAVADAALPVGSILQVKQSKKIDVSSTTDDDFVDIPGTDEAGSGSVWECNITLAVANNVLVIPLVQTAGVDATNLRLLRTTSGSDTSIAVGATATSKLSTFWGAYCGGASDGTGYFGTIPVSGYWLDVNPGVGTHTYRIQYHEDSSQTSYINRSSYDGSYYNIRPASTLTLMEVKA